MNPSVHTNVLDYGLDYIKQNCNKVIIAKQYAAGDSYATVTIGSNVIAEVTLTSTDFTLAAGATSNSRKITSASGKQDASANNSSQQYTNGTATSGGSTTLTDSSKSWTVNAYANKAVVISAGTGSGQHRTIASNTATALTVDTAWTTNPDATSVYAVVDDLVIVFLDTVNSRILWTTDETSDQIVTAGNPINFPSVSFTIAQPTAG